MVMHDTRHNGDGMVMGFLVGTIIGAGMALLMAPAAGTETRRKLGNAARRFGGEARTRVDDAAHRVKETVRDVTSDIREAYDRGRDSYEP